LRIIVSRFVKGFKVKEGIKKSPHCAVGYDGPNLLGYRWVLSLGRLSVQEV
jgi:hypothetical protein